MSTLVVFAAALTILTAALALLYIGAFSYARLRFNRRMLNLGGAEEVKTQRPSDWRHVTTPLEGTRWGKKTQEALRLADLDVTPTVYWVARLLLIGGLYVALGGILGLNTGVDLVASVLGASLIVRSYLKSRQDHYIASFDAQMPEVALLMGNSLRAGLSVLQAFEVAAERMARPASREFDRVAREIRLGKSLDDSMLGMLDRLPSEELRLMVTTILIQRVAGGNLAHALSVMSDAISARFKLRDEVRTMTAEARYSGMILVVMPFAVLGILNQLMEGAVGQFLGNPVGWVIGGLFVGVLILGFTLISRVSRVQV
ncbi:MAG: type II secretion system F family protein [Chloroflexi bacterium]|nr:type II secretion system F family protein [Chloroflexota bacterium]